MTSRQVDTLYCDDIRQEVNGKLSFIGVYQSRLIVPSFPVTLPKLGVVIKVRTPIENPFQSLTIQVRKNEGDPADESCEEQIKEISVDADELSAAMENLESEWLPDYEGSTRFHTMQFLIIFAPLQLAGPGLLRVYVYTEAEPLRGPALTIAQSDEQNSTGSNGE